MTSSLTSLFIYLLALLPAIGWILVYRYLDSRDPEPMKATSMALVWGILSTVPVFGLQFFFSAYPDYDLLSMLQSNVTNPLVFSALFLVFVAVIEELVKAGAFIIIIRKYEAAFNQVVDGIVYAAFIGIGFAFAENIYYFTRAIEAFQLSGNFMAVFSIRSFGTMLAHTLFTGLFGFYFAKAYFSPFIEKTSHKEKLWHNLKHNVKQAVRLRATCLHLLPGRDKEPMSIKRNVMIFEGFLVAVLVHFLYNGLIKLEVFGKNWTFLIVPLLFVSAWFVWSRFFVPLYVKIVTFVKTRKGLYRVKVR
jgi:RsiW-degrading membrane proteinase PrsW (M82 family)